jgi:hypothetical protein
MRQLDGKYSLDGEEIIKTATGEPIPHDEPVIVFRGRDKLLVQMLIAYRKLCLEDNCTDYQMKAVSDQMLRFYEFSVRHPERMKQPGCTLGK